MPDKNIADAGRSRAPDALLNHSFTIHNLWQLWNHASRLLPPMTTHAGAPNTRARAAQTPASQPKQDPHERFTVFAFYFFMVSAVIGILAMIYEFATM